MKLLHTGNLFWPTTLNNPTEYKPLNTKIRVNTAIVGGGMSGAIIGYIFAASGISTAILERERVAGGSTVASTGLLQFSNDIMLCDLIDQIGAHDAIQFYTACRAAIKQLTKIAEQLPVDVGLRMRNSLYYASTEQDLPHLIKEYETLRANGFDVSFWSSDEISKLFPFHKPGAIVTQGDAEVNPYHFAQGIADAAHAAGLQIYEHTDVIAHETTADGIHRLQTSDGYEVEADNVIYAVGYESEELRSQLIKANINRTFVAVTGIQNEDSLQHWHKRYLIWETARPYLYMRTTLDGRVIIGGLDEEMAEPVKGEQSRYKRTDKLHEKLLAHFPMLDAPIEFEWSGTFGESRDRLPFIGQDPASPGVYYALGYGGNGSVYSIIAAYLLRNLINGENHPLTNIVRLDRPSLQ